MFKYLKKKLRDWLKEPTVEDKKDRLSFLQDLRMRDALTREQALEFLQLSAFQVKELIFKDMDEMVNYAAVMDARDLAQGDDSIAAMDAAPDAPKAKFKSISTDNSNFGQFNILNILPTGVMSWFAAQSFIGYQLCGIIAQHWMVTLALKIPADKAASKGWELTVNDGTKIEKNILDAMRHADVRLNIKNHLVDFITKGRMFGIRIAYFDIDVPNKREYYAKPFNIDGIRPGSYKGIIQVDPFWTVPIFISQESLTPGNQRFYEPDGWQIGGLFIHWTHIFIFRNGPLADTLKPTYFFGSVSLCQQIYNRVYQFERIADEASLLALTKRTIVYTTDLSAAAAKGQKFIDTMEEKKALRTNYATEVIGTDDKLTQLDTNLADLDENIMAQAQYVAAISRIPASLLLQTPPRGFNATGEYEESNFYSFVEDLRENDGTPFLTRHYQILIRSEIVPRFGVTPFDVTITWNPLDPLSAEEKANINKVKADTDAQWKAAGAIDENDIRDRLILDPDSGYSGIPSGAPEPEEDFSDDEDNGDEEDGDEENTE